MKQKLGVQYKVLKRFQDKDTKVLYSPDSFYANEDQERVDFLIKEGYLAERSQQTETTSFPKHTGGGWYELSNGEKVKGKDEATAAEEGLNKEGE